MVNIRCSISCELYESSSEPVFWGLICLLAIGCHEMIRLFKNRLQRYCFFLIYARNRTRKVHFFCIFRALSFLISFLLRHVPPELVGIGAFEPAFLARMREECHRMQAMPQAVRTPHVPRILKRFRIVRACIHLQSHPDFTYPNFAFFFHIPFQNVLFHLRAHPVLIPWATSMQPLCNKCSNFPSHRSSSVHLS